MKNFDFNTQTAECEYCSKRVAVNFVSKHFEFCESEEGRNQFEPYSICYEFNPLSSAVGMLNYGAEKFGKDKPLDSLLNGSIGSFSEERTENTIRHCLESSLYKMSFEQALELMTYANCPLCHKNPCKCGENEE